MATRAKILVIDDEPYLLRAATLMLQAAGYQVIEADTGFEGVRLAKETIPELILVDVVLPDIDGLEVCRRIKADPTLAGCFVVLLSAIKTTTYEQATGLEVGADGYIARPISNREFLARVQTLVRLQQAQAERDAALRALQQAYTEIEARVAARTAELGQANRELRDSEARYRALVEASPTSIMVVQHGRYIFSNLAGARMLGLETPQKVIGLPAIDTIAPGSRQLVQERIAGATAGRSNPPVEIELLRPDGSTLPVESTSVPIRLHGEPAILIIGQDLTERKRGEETQRLYTGRLELLYRVAQGILSADTPQAIAATAAAHLRQLVPCCRAGVTLFDQTANQAEILAVDTEVKTRVPAGLRVSLERFGPQINLLQQNKLAQTPVHPDDEIMAALYAEGVHRIVGVPMMFQNKLIGSVDFGLARSDNFGPEHENFTRQVASQLAIAIEQSRLREEVQRYTTELEKRVADRTRELAALYDVTALASASMSLKELLVLALGHVLTAMQTEMGIIYLLDEPGQTLQAVVQQGVSPELAGRLAGPHPHTGLGWVLEHREPLVAADISADPRLPAAAGVPGLTCVAVPIQAQDQVFGVLSILKSTTQPPFSVEEITLLTAIADHVGVVVNSARLRRRAEQAAVMAERERLARELHDSVTQSLYSLTLFAEWTRRLCLNGDMANALNRLDRIGETAQQALKEMRLLLYELRPSLLEQDGLAGALQHRLEAVEKRAGVEVTLHTNLPAQLPPKLEEGLYRIAQEALNNALKHAAASTVTVRVQADGPRLTLTVEDDGRGFDPQAVSDTAGLGLAGMRTRAEQLGGNLKITSAPGKGTTVQVTTKIKPEKTTPLPGTGD